MKKKKKHRQRKLGAAISFDGYLNSCHGKDDIELTITGTYENWNKLRDRIIKRTEWERKAGISLFDGEFFGSFVSPALEGSLEELSTPWQGIHGSKLSDDDAGTGVYGKYVVMRGMKIISALLFIYFEYWLNQPEKERPDYLKELDIPPQCTDSLQFTAWCMQLTFNKKIKQYNIQPLIGSFMKGMEVNDRFDLTYIKGGEKILKKTTDAKTLDAVVDVMLSNRSFLDDSYVMKATSPETLAAASENEKYTDCTKIFKLIDNLVHTYLGLYSPHFGMLPSEHRDYYYQHSIVQPLVAFFPPPSKD